MNIILAPDSFKGTISSREVCGIMADELTAVCPGSRITSIPVADGGEGTVDCFVTALGGEVVRLRVSGPYFEPVDSFYGIVTDAAGRRTAIVEMAAAAGLPMAEASGGSDPCRTTTYGVGELILDAVRRDCRRVIVGLGGSCTTDGGCGMAAALGVVFRDGDGCEFVPVGGSIGRVADIDMSGRACELDGVELVAMCDVDNPMYGPEGAAYVFAPQKGADAAAVGLLDAGLRSLCAVMERKTGRGLSTLAGGGAAGGLGAGIVAFLGAELRRGIDAVLDTVGFDEALRQADFVFTGEGRMDAQSVRGKVISGVAARAAAVGVPVIAVVGDAAPGAELLLDAGLCSVFSINRRPLPFEQVRGESAENLRFAMKNIARLISAARRTVTHPTIGEKS